MYIYIPSDAHPLKHVSPGVTTALQDRSKDLQERAPHVNLHVTPHFYSNTVLNITLSSGVWLYRACVNAQTRHFKNRGFEVRY